MNNTSSSEVSRRRFLASLGIITAGAGLAAVAGCGSDGTSGTNSGSASAGAGSGTAASTGGATSTAGGSSAVTSSAGGQGGSAASSSGSAAAAGGTVTIGLATISAYLNPLTSTNSAINWVTDPVVETLYTYDDELNSVPLLADGDPDISEDGLTWTIKIKDGVKFSNGDALTADHVAAVLKFVTDPKATSDWTSFFGYRTKSVQAVDDSTVKIVLLAPYGVMRQHLTNLPIIHKDYVKRTDTTVGTGPFKIGKSIQGQSISLTRNDTYHGDPPSLDAVEFTAVPDPGTRLVNLRQGTIDVMTDVPAENVAELQQDASIAVHVVDAPRDILTYFVVNKPPFDNVKVRQAVGWAMDRAGVNELVYANTATIGQGPISPAEEGYNPDAAHYGDVPDVDKAKALIAEAGMPDVSFRLMVVNSQKDINNLAQVLIEGWRQAGIDVTLESIDISSWVGRWVKGDYQMALSIYDSGIGGGKTSFVLLSSLSSTNPLNFGYKNAKVDQLLASAWATSDTAARVDACSQVDALLAADAIAMPPVYPKFIVAQRKDISPMDEKQMAVSRIKAGQMSRRS